MENSDAQPLLDELRLYYEEIRDINAKTISYLKILGVFGLSLASYMLFGLRTVSTGQFNVVETAATTELASLERLAFAGWAYAVIGLGLTAFLQFVCCLAIMQYGRSKCHKTRYWRCVSMLREKLHQRIGILGHRGRAIPIQTGLELGEKEPYEGLIPRPIIHRRDYYLGYFLAALSLALFMIPTIFFATVWDYCAWSFKADPWTSLTRAFCRTAAPTALVTVINFALAIEFCQRLKSAQFATPVEIYPRINENTPTRRERNALNSLRGILIAVGLVYSVLAFVCIGRTPSAAGVWLAVFLIVGAFAERTVTALLKQYPTSGVALWIVAKALRVFTKNEYVKLEQWMPKLLPAERIKRMVARFTLQRRIRPLGEPTRVRLLEDGQRWRCFHLAWSELMTTGKTRATAIHQLSALFREKGYSQERADVIAFLQQQRDEGKPDGDPRV